MLKLNSTRLKWGHNLRFLSLNFLLKITEMADYPESIRPFLIQQSKKMTTERSYVTWDMPLSLGASHVSSLTSLWRLLPKHMTWVLTLDSLTQALIIKPDVNLIIYPTIEGWWVLVLLLNLRFWIALPFHYSEWSVVKAVSKLRWPETQ